jgi:hypothetical protein
MKRKDTFLAVDKRIVGKIRDVRSTVGGRLELHLNGLAPRSFGFLMKQIARDRAVEIRAGDLGSWKFAARVESFTPADELLIIAARGKILFRPGKIPEAWKAAKPLEVGYTVKLADGTVRNVIATGTQRAPARKKARKKAVSL